ncbi:nucleotidyltransferase domain-containing protein [Bdellovibrionota bacterium FG-2]
MDLALRQLSGAWLRDHALSLLNPRPRCLAVFGSFSAGTLHAESDFDVLVIGDQIPKRPFARTQWFFPLAELWRSNRPDPTAPFSIAPLFISEAGWRGSIGLRLSLAQNCWILWDDGFLSESLEESRKWINNGDYHKKTTPDGGWMWIPRGISA